METIRQHFTTIDSTNTWGKQHAHLLDPTKVTIVTADEQTGGRGRFQRQWISPPKQNIYASFCFFIEKHRSDIGNLPQVLAVSAAEILEQRGFKPKLKWPNDVLLSDKKVAGILCETTPLSDQLCVVLGIGLNVNMEPALLQQIDRPATSLFAEDGQKRDLDEVFGLLQNQFLTHLSQFIDEGFHPFLEKYKQRMIHHIGDPIRFHDNRMELNGVFQEITSAGALVLRLEDGSLRTFIAGEIVEWTKDEKDERDEKDEKY